MKVNELAKRYGDREVNIEEFEKILLPKKKKSVYDLEEGDKYYLVAEEGDIRTYSWEGYTCELSARKHGRLFLTEKEAKLYASRERINEELRRYAELHNDEEIDWTDSNQWKWHLTFQKTYGFRCRGACENRSINEVYFTENIFLEEVVNHIGEESLLKEWVGIDDE